MAQYINKDALVAEITSLKVKFDCGWNCAIDKVLEHIDDLEVKEVDNDCPKLDRYDTISPLIGGSFPDATISVVEHNSEKWVRVQATGEDFIIAPRDLDDSKAFTYDEAMERLKEVGLDTFNRKQGFIIAISINEINTKLSEIGGEPMDKYAYVSNELCKTNGSVGEYGANFIWYFDGDYRCLDAAYLTSFNSVFRCRPCVSYSEANMER